MGIIYIHISKLLAGTSNKYLLTLKTCVLLSKEHVFFLLINRGFELIHQVYVTINSLDRNNGKIMLFSVYNVPLHSFLSPRHENTPLL